MEDETKISVPKQKGKLIALTRHAESERALGFPCTNKAIADQMSVALQTERRSARKITGGTLSKAGSIDGDHRQLTVREHKALLALFQIKWPCPTYFDPERKGRDAKLEAFEKWLETRNAPQLQLTIHKRDGDNKPSFSNRDLLTFRMETHSTTGEYVGELIVNPARQRVTDPDESPGRLLGFYGIAELTLRVLREGQVVLKVQVSTPSEPRKYDIRNRSADDDFAVLMSSCADQSADEPYLNGEFRIATLTVTEMEDGGLITIEASTQLPNWTPKIPKAVVERSHLDEEALTRKLERIVDAVIRERYLDIASSTEGNPLGILLGRQTYRRTEPK